MSKIIRLLVQPFTFCGRLLAKIAAAIFGNLSWRPPLWLRNIAHYSRAHPRSVSSAFVLMLVLAAGYSWSWHWYQHRPKPHLVYARIAPIPVTSLEAQLKFPPLFVEFSESAARLDDLHKTTLALVRLEPALPGNWKWISDRKLTFEPTQDWPANRKLSVVFDKQFFPPHVRMEKLQFETSTPPFTISIQSTKLSEDANEPGVQRIIASLELSHAVQPGELEKHTDLRMIGGSSIFAANDAGPHFKIVYGLHNRRAFVRSSPIVLPEREDWMRIVVGSHVRTSQGGAESDAQPEAKILVPGRDGAFQIESVEGAIVRDKNGEPERILNVETSSDAVTEDLAKAFHIFLLPKRHADIAAPAEASDSAEEISTEESTDSENEDDETTEKNSKEEWSNAEEVTDEVLAQSKPVRFTAIPSQKERERDHHFRIRVEGDGQLYVRFDKGVRGSAGYELAHDFTSIVAAPKLPQEIEFQGDGGLLALSGEHKISIRSRGVPLIKFEIDRVASNQINHLVSQTEGEFQAPEFRSYSFDQDNISRIAREEQRIALENNWKANYSAFDFSQHLRKPADGGSERGLFFLHAKGWDPATKKPIKSATSSRFILVTDLGLLVKKNADGSSDVFVASIKTGQPVAGVGVELLGRNGVAVQAGQSSADGRVSFASVAKNEHEKKPVAYVARLGDDVSFIPYSRDDRVLNFSRFDVGGVENALAENLEAFVFTDRGIYRPSDEMHIGLVVKQRNWSGNLAGLPVETEVVDARNLAVQTKKIALPASGFVEVDYRTAYESPTGEYAINVYLVKNDKRSTLLGSTTVNVKEFLPDRMKIETQLSKSATRGWVDPNAMHASIALANLYGTPATDRLVKSHVELSPVGFSFPELRDYTFYDALLDEKKERHHESVDLGEQKTDTDGRADLELQLERFADATYAMQFFAEGFEGEGGRSVTGQSAALVSALPYVVGYKADGDLHYINTNTPRILELVAVDPQLNRIALDNVTLNVIAEEYVSVVTKKEDDSYGYESVLKERVAATEKITSGAGGLHYPLSTTEPGDYVVELRGGDAQRRLAKIRFAVVGRGGAKRSLDKNAELQVKLDRAQYNTGEEIEISITAPYAGSGLITIERDKVYAQRWFKSDSANSVQRIRVPDDFEGSGYVNVAFIRALDSKEIFTSPLSYGVVPFIANMEKRLLKVQLETAAVAKPGEPFHIRYTTDRACKIAIFAVDEGILQVSDYKLPEPLAFFFRKCALSVETAQIVDLIMPEFSILRAASAFGGDGDAQKQLNPFRRVTEKPVVFWSGIVDAGKDSREVVYDVPDYFSGTLKVMAVAVSDDATGSTERDSIIRGPFVLTPSVPTLAAPGDRFEVGLTVANNVEGSGENAEVQLRVETSENLTVSTGATQSLHITQGRELSATVSLRANDKLGSGTITFIATSGPAETRLRSTISVRPPTPYATTVIGGSFRKGTVDVPITRDMYPEFRRLNATVASVPLGLAHGLDVYLHEFPHGCSEQITSGAFCRLALAGESDFGLNRAEANKQLESVFATLRRRQNDAGAFGYWSVEKGQEISFISAYVMHFLSEAKAAGFPPPTEMFASGLRNLQTMAAKEPSNLYEARTVAYAIYVLTHEGVITTNYILNLRDYLEKNHANEWRRDLTAVYLAGALQNLRMGTEGSKLIAGYRTGQQDSAHCNDFYQPLGADAQFIAVLAREFPDRLKKITAAELESVLRPVSDGSFNTLSAAYAVLALKSYGKMVAQHPPELTISEIAKDKRENRLASGTKLLQRVDLSGSAAAVRFGSASALAAPGAFYQLVTAGYDRHVPTTAQSSGLEILREFLDQSGKPVTTTKLGTPVNVRLHVRCLRDEPVTNLAITDLLPGGFEVVGSSLKPGVSAIDGVDYVEVREDRAVFFATVSPAALQITYQIKSVNRGEFVVPPVFAESMYDRGVRAQGVGGKITVVENVK